jgi:hypothetical protein
MRVRHVTISSLAEPKSEMMLGRGVHLGQSYNNKTDASLSNITIFIAAHPVSSRSRGLFLSCRSIREPRAATAAVENTKWSVH